MCSYDMMLIYEVSSLCCYSFDEGKGIYMRHFLGSVSSSMSMGLPMSMSLSMSPSMSMSMSFSMSMSMSMKVVAPLSPHILHVPSFPSMVSETNHPTFKSYEPSSVRLESPEATEVSYVLSFSRAPSVSVSMVTSSSVTRESVPKNDDIDIGASETSANSMENIKSPFSDGSSPSKSSSSESSPSNSSSSFFLDVIIPILVTMTVLLGMVVGLVVYRKTIYANAL